MIYRTLVSCHLDHAQVGEKMEVDCSRGTGRRKQDRGCVRPQLKEDGCGMYDVLRRAIIGIDSGGLRKLWFLGFAMSASGVLDVVGVGSIIPFTTLLVQPDIVVSNPYFAHAMTWTGASSPRELTIFLGLGTLAFLVVVNALQMWTVWLLLDFTWSEGRKLSARLLESYLARPYAWFLRRHTSGLLNMLFQEVQRTIGSVLDPALVIVARGVAALCLVGFLIYLNPVVALGATILFGGAYGTLYLVLRPYITRTSIEAKQAREETHKVATEALNAIKDVKLNGLARFMLARYDIPSHAMARREAVTRMLANAPRYLLEIVALGGFIVGALFLAAPAHEQGSAVPLLAAYAFAGYRLMPSLQQIYASVTHLRYNIVSLESILRDITEVEARIPEAEAPRGASPFREGRIEFEGVAFEYSGAREPVLRGIDAVIEPKTSVGIIGQTGSGKTTMVDLIMGLLEPTDGRILIDGVALSSENMAHWQAHIGYVPQSLYLTDDTIASNIAFGVPPHEIDLTRVARAAKAAHLDTLIEDSPKGYDSQVGERGARLSSGQRQRIGIARALYRNPKVLILDEATSALDYETESAVMDAVMRLSHKLTIIMIAHRLHTIKSCEFVFEVRDGKLRRLTDFGQTRRGPFPVAPRGE